MAKNYGRVHLKVLEEVEGLLQQERYPEAAQLLTKYLNENMDDPKAVFLLGHCFQQTEGLGLAYQLYMRAGQIHPNEPSVWHNIGTLYHQQNDDSKAEEYFRRALKCKPNFAESLEGLSMCALNKGEFGQCIEYANRALAEKPESIDSRTNRGMAYLSLKRWREGWRDYNANLGHDKNRKEIIYGDEPRWDGSKGKNIVVYGEQGLGDEISFASCLPDLIRDSKSVTIDCDARLKNLFQRSFPATKVHGTRYSKEEETWRRAEKFDARVAMGELPLYYRQKDEHFTGEPYLKPNPQIALQWRALLDSLGPKPKIGITWTGGLLHTGMRRRSVTLDTFAPLFKGFDADWISLQYKDADVSASEKYGVRVHDFDWGTRVFDYDHTVALVSELDLVISVCTAVVDVCAAIGKECWCLVPSVPIWRHLAAGENYLWGRSVSLYRQRGREWPIFTLLGKLKDRWPDSARSEHRERAQAAA